MSFSMRKTQRLSTMRGLPSRTNSMSGESGFLVPETCCLKRQVIGNTGGVTTVEDRFCVPTATQIDQPPEDNPSRIAGLPVYLGPDGTFYDIDYNRIPSSGLPSDGQRLSADHGLTPEMKDVYNTASIEAHQPAGEKALGDLYRSFPDPSQCTSYEDLEARLVKWHEDMERSLGYVVAPRVMGRCYSRPKVTTYRDESGSNGGEGSGAAAAAAAAEMNAGGDQQQQQMQPQQMQQQQVLSEDPWEAVLVPPEPDPHFYEDFDQYELAMKKWYNECCQGEHKLRRMLPHPSQFKEMQTLKIQPAKEVFSFARNLGAGDSAAKAADSFAFVGVVPGYKNPYVRDKNALAAAKAASRILPPPPPPASEATLTLAQRYRRETERAAATADDDAGSSAELSALAQQDASYAAQAAAAAEKAAVSAAARNAVEQSKAAAAELDRELDRLLGAAEQNSGEYGVTNRPVAVVTLTEKYDTQVDLKRLGEVLNGGGNAYLEEKRAEYEKIQNAWKVRERALLTQDTEDFRNNFLECLRSGGAGPAHVVQAIKVPISHEMFRRLMETKLPDGATAYELLASGITAELFPELLAQWELVKDPAVREKLAYFVCEFVKRNPERTGAALCAEPSHDTCRALYGLARCAHYGTAAQPDIYPFADETLALVEQLALREGAETLKMEEPAACTDAILTTFQCYYLGLVQGALNQPAVQKALATCEQRLVAIVGKAPKVVVVLFHCLSHRSVTISGLCLFVITRLLRTQNSELIGILSDPSAYLFDEVLALCFRNFSHVQFAVRRLLEILLSPTWHKHLFDFFSMGNRLLLPFNILDCSAGIENCGVTQLYAEFVERIYATCYTVGGKDAAFASHQTWAFGTEAFTALTDGIRECIKVGLYYGAAALARVVNHLCVTSFNLKAITTPSVKSGSALALIIYQEDIDALIGHIVTLSKLNDMATYPVSAPILSAVRILLRNQFVYSEYQAKERLIQNILAFCKDGKDSEFNRQAWKVFYELIEYHAGAIELMDNASLLTQFTNFLGTNVNGTTVTIHSIRYFRKILELGSADQSRRSVKRDDKKSIEKDVKFFTNFFKEKTLFVKFHMTYKNQTSMCGAVFYEVAQVYQKLQVLPETQKLLKDILKNPDYRKGLQDIHEMFPPN